MTRRGVCFGVSGGYIETYVYDPVGNLTLKGSLTQFYTSTRPHAVTSFSNGSSFKYDLNGNTTRRVESGVTYTQAWDVDNCLVDMASGTQHTQFFYDSDGTLEKKVEPRGTTAYVSAGDEISSLVPTQTVTVPPTFTHKLYISYCCKQPAIGHESASTTNLRGLEAGVPLHRETKSRTFTQPQTRSLTR